MINLQWLFLTILAVSHVALTTRREPQLSPKGTRVVDTLKFVVVVARHGNRTPLYYMKNDPYPFFNSSIWPYGIEGLTGYGRVQMYNMGKQIRSMYDGFLSPSYFGKDFFATSTAVDRVVISASCLLAGLYPPKDYQIWNQNISWTPIPIFQDSLDMTEAVNWQCPAFNTAQEPVKAAFAKKWATEISEVEAFVSENLKDNITGTLGIVTIWDSFLSEATEGFKLPSWTEKVYPKKMSAMLNDMYVQYVAANDLLVQLVIGPFFKNMVEVMQSKVNGSLIPDRKMFLYSGHDDTLVTLQAALGLVGTKQITGIVNPGSAMTFELHQQPTTQRWFMKVLYIDSFTKNLKPRKLKTPLCGGTCYFDRFIENTKKFYNFSSWEELCQSKS